MCKIFRIRSLEWQVADLQTVNHLKHWKWRYGVNIGNPCYILFNANDSKKAETYAPRTSETSALTFTHVTDLLKKQFEKILFFLKIFWQNDEGDCTSQSQVVLEHMPRE